MTGFVKIFQSKLHYTLSLDKCKQGISLRRNNVIGYTILSPLTAPGFYLKIGSFETGLFSKPAFNRVRRLLMNAMFLICTTASQGRVWFGANYSCWLLISSEQMRLVLFLVFHSDD